MRVVGIPSHFQPFAFGTIGGPERAILNSGIVGAASHRFESRGHPGAFQVGGGMTKLNDIRPIKSAHLGETTPRQTSQAEPALPVGHGAQTGMPGASMLMHADQPSAWHSLGPLTRRLALALGRALIVC